MIVRLILTMIDLSLTDCNTFQTQNTNETEKGGVSNDKHKTGNLIVLFTLR